MQKRASLRQTQSCSSRGGGGALCGEYLMTNRLDNELILFAWRISIHFGARAHTRSQPSSISAATAAGVLHPFHTVGRRRFVAMDTRHGGPSGSSFVGCGGGSDLFSTLPAMLGPRLPPPKAPDSQFILRQIEFKICIHHREALAFFFYYFLDPRQKQTVITVKAVLEMSYEFHEENMSCQLI
jgi:hypothetical protein